MSTYTVTLTDKQEAALQVLASNEKLPASEYLQARVSDLTNSYVQQQELETTQKLVDAYKAAGATEQAQVKATLGV